MFLPPEIVRPLGYLFIAVTTALAVAGLIVGARTGANLKGLEFAGECAGAIAIIGLMLWTRHDG